MRYPSKEYFTIPNILSYIRLLLIPVFLFLYLNAETPRDYLWAAAVILLSGLTDFVDGQIARRCNMVTEWGKLIDPIADKFTQAAVLFALVVRVKWMWLLALLLVVKELMMAACGLFFLRKGKKLDGAKWFGKISTTGFYFCTFVLVAVPTLDQTFTYILMAVTGFFLALSMVLYSSVFWNMHKED